ncbi:c-type cytochrome, partial [Singulisphaera rosea]
PDAGVPFAERQRALATLGDMKTPPADALLKDWTTRLATGGVPLGLQLDVVEAARTRGTPEILGALETFQSSQSKADPLAAVRFCLEGGDRERGRIVFAGHAQAECIRCHRVGGQGGVAGPDLSDVASRGDRAYFLQSLMEPDAKIASGYGTIVLALEDGQIVSGILKSEANGKITVETPGGQVVVPADKVEERSAVTSAMPKVGTILSPRELRDVVEFLSGLKTRR